LTIRRRPPTHPLRGAILRAFAPLALLVSVRPPASPLGTAPIQTARLADFRLRDARKRRLADLRLRSFSRYARKLAGRRTSLASGNAHRLAAHPCLQKRSARSTAV